jgi:hypothetical protein
MKTSLASLALAAGIALTAPTVANAAITITRGTFTDPAPANSLVYTFEDGSVLPTLSGATGSGGIAPNLGTGTNPPVPGGDTSSYFYSFSNTEGQLLTLTVAAGSRYFGLYWGSIDTFNSIVFLNNGVQVGEVTGSQARVSSATLSGDRTSPDTNLFVGMTTDFDFDAVGFKSTGSAFESDNWTVIVPPPIDQGDVPEPAPLLLVGAGLLALYVGLRRRAA